MDRIFFLFLLLSVQSVLLPSIIKSLDKNLDEALFLLSQDSNNFDLIQSKLTQSSSPEALAVLGELYLLGYNIDPDLSKAIYYFHSSYIEGSAEAGFYIYVILLQGKFFNISLESFGIPEPTEDFMKSLYKQTLSRGSYLMRAYAVNNYYRCASDYESQYLKQLNIDFGLECWHSTQEISEFAVQVAEKSIESIIKQAHYYLIPGLLEENTMFGSETDNLLRMLSIAIEDLSSASITIIAENYIFGNPDLGIERNISKSIELYEKAALKEQINALETLSIIYFYGLGTIANFTKSLEYLLPALKMNSTRALGIAWFFYEQELLYTNLGSQVIEYIIDKGIFKNYKKDEIQKLYDLVANSLDNLDKILQLSLEELENFDIKTLDNYEDVISEVENFLGTSISEIASINEDSESMSNYAFQLYINAKYLSAGIYFESSANLGYHPAMYNYALLCLQGNGVEKSIEKAIDYLSLVIENGDLSKYSRIGYKKAQTKEFIGAFWALSISAMLGYKDSLYNLVYLMKKGDIPFSCNVDKDICLGRWYLALVQMNEDFVKKEIGKMALKCDGVFGCNYTEAYEMFRNTENYDESKYYIGFLYEEGLGVYKNLTKAQEIYKNIMNNSTDKEAYLPAAAAWARAYGKEVIENMRKIKSWAGWSDES
ncbi:hypothetical protein SteCoe_25746 [Stentor coeruleus]|uniref:Sel1 repeat family protein n=1 Tax=Stentor coeruleus TaxID=5963 RepID=A0A1R2BEJ3_9CILI|nr:hypothetical protein SteCoe_25746 [Stentor coeruleus]